MASLATPKVARSGKLLIHRVWHVGTGKMRPDKAQDFVDDFRARVKGADGGGEKLAELMDEGIVFYDVFIPCPGATGSDITVTMIRPGEACVNEPRHGNLDFKYE